MQINLNTTEANFPILSPIFDQSPMWSPLPEDTLRKYSYNYDDFGSFRLEAYEDANYLLPNIQQVPAQYRQELDNQSEQKISEQKQILPLQQQIQVSRKESKSEVIKEHEIQIENQCMDDEQRQSREQSQRRVSSNPSLENLIQYLIRNINKDQVSLKFEALELVQDKQIYPDIIAILIKKFKKTKKTKQEMVKYCMRKAFKFIADKMKKDRTHNRDIDSCMKMYFSKNQVNNNFSIPFKKNSTEKTMNGSFLKRVFSSNAFVQDYRQFLEQFQGLVEDDNYKKVKYLSDLMSDYLKNRQYKKIQTIKRLPWTQQTLDQTLQLSKTLIEYADKDSPIINLRRKGQQSKES